MFKRGCGISGILVLILVFSLGLNLDIKKSVMNLVFAQTDFAEEKKPDLSQSPAENPKYQLIENLKKGNDNSAVRLAEEYLALNPDDVDILCLLAEAYIRKNNLPAAEEASKKAVAVKPNSSFANTVLANIYVLKANADSAEIPEALKKIDKALKLNPKDISLLISKAELYLATGEAEKANSLLIEAGKMNIDSSQQQMLTKLKQMVNKTDLEEDDTEDQ
ncbi:MAG: tetratricopeptide repeat protein [Candidatus Omnitrophica bacterium]|nr:tetratricopeptide repeat protein [Candidatus Omnitrophota bacterium]